MYKCKGHLHHVYNFLTVAKMLHDMRCHGGGGTFKQILLTAEILPDLHVNQLRIQTYTTCKMSRLMQEFICINKININQKVPENGSALLKTLPWNTT